MKRIIVMIAAAALAFTAASAQSYKFAHVNFQELVQLMPEMDSARVQIDEIQNRIQDFEQSVQQEMQQLQNQLMGPIYQKAQEAVSNLAKAGGYIYVFDASQVLYIDASQSTDLTPEARTALNIPADRTLESLQQELQARAQATQAAPVQ